MTVFWRDRPVLVTGATGFLGRWLVQALASRAARPVALVRLASATVTVVRDGAPHPVPAVVGDLHDLERLQRTIADFGIRTIFHLAAQALVGAAKADPLHTLETNVRGTWTVLEAARRSGDVQVITASSDKAYGDSTELPYRETLPLQGAEPYDVSKSCADLIARMYARAYGAPVATARWGNLFGGGDLNVSRTVPGAILSALRDEPFRIRSDGRVVRDFLYVEDAVDGALVLAEKLAADPGVAGEAFNFSLGRRLTILELVAVILGLMGKAHLQPVVLNEASGEARERYMVSDRARERLGWVPKVGLEDGLRRTIEWYVRHAAAAAGAGER